MAEHDRQFSPSSSARWIECTASVPLVEGKNTPANKAMAEGTFAHSMFERRIIGGDRTPRLGIDKEVEGFEFEYDEEMKNHLDTAQGWVDELGPGLVFSEAKVELTVTYGAAGEFTRVVKGTSDVTVQADAEPGVLHIMDLKYGQGVKVFADNNSQLMLYAAAALEHFAMLIEDIHTVVLHILQPRLGHHDEFRISVPDLMDWVQGPVSSAVGSVLLEEGVKFAPSKKACQWCPIAPCTAALAAVGDLFEDLTEEGIEQANGDALGKFLNDMPFYSMIAKAATTKATEMLARNEPVAGHKLVEGKGGARVWMDEEAAEKAMLDEGLDPYTEPKLISVAAAEKLYGGKKKFAETEVVDLIHKPKGNPTLTTTEDKRPALNFAPVTFDNLEGEEDG